MAATKAKKEDSFLKTIWNRTQEGIEAVKMGRAEKALKLEAEKHCMDAANKVTDAEDSFEKAIAEALETRDFSKIVDASLAKKTADRKLEEAKYVYESLFNGSPKFLED